MEPFGCANPEPLLVCRDMTLVEVSPTKNPVHVRALLRSPLASVTAMAFNMGDRFDTAMIGRKIDVAFKPKLDEWRGSVSLKWHLQDLSDASPDEIQLGPGRSESTVLV